MGARFQLSRGLVCAAVLASCGGNEKSADTAEDTHVAPDTNDAHADTAPDVDPNATVCCPVGTCADSSQQCVNGACEPKEGDGGCYFDAECRDGKTCQGATYCACGATGCAAKAGTCGFGAGCCNADGDCGGGELCVAGTCRGKPDGGCWRDGQCGAGEVCEGMKPNPCGQRTVDVPGHCALPGVCCESDAECGAGVCKGGRCVDKPAAGGCWSDGDCKDGDACLGAELCPCAVGASSTAACAVPSTAGRCGKAADSCCSKDLDCGAGELCVAGACAKAPDRAKDECWVDGHCGVGRECVGAHLCGCHEASCDSKVGQCKTDSLACLADADCPTAMRCIVPDALYCPFPDLESSVDALPQAKGTCVERVDTGCWQKADCATDLRCGAEVVCTDPNGCDVPNQPGDCRTPVRRWDCCDAHDECKDGYECRNYDSSLTCPPTTGAVCLDKARFGETCWNAQDCPTGLTCQRVWICGCNGKCYFNHQGECERPTNCQSNLDCGDGYVCALDPECFYSPCTTAVTCQSGGQCQEKVDGGCWSHDECGEGNYCAGLRVCPSDTTCTVPDQPGICAPRAGLGECCTSFRGCQPGLRCLSPAQRSGCKIDNTSVCVPAVTPGISCFGDEDCDSGQHCEGALVCPCGVTDCTHEPQAGSCEAN